VKRVKVDFSSTVKDGLIRANQMRASELLLEGDEVEAYDSAEDMEFIGVVDHLSEDGRFAFLRMQWEDAETALPSPRDFAPDPPTTYAFVGARAVYAPPVGVTLLDPAACSPV
jgi:hypothetical protein